MSFYDHPTSTHAVDEPEAEPARAEPLGGNEKAPFAETASGEESPPAPNVDSAEGASINLPDAVAELRKSDPAFYDPMGTYRSALGVGTLNEALPDQSEHVVREVAHMARDAGLTDGEFQQVIQLTRSSADEQTQQQWRADSERYLDTISDQDVAAVVRLLDRDPRVEKLLGDRINHPEIAKLSCRKSAGRTRPRTAMSAQRKPRNVWARPWHWKPPKRRVIREHELPEAARRELEPRTDHGRPR